MGTGERTGSPVRSSVLGLGVAPHGSRASHASNFRLFCSGSVNPCAKNKGLSFERPLFHLVAGTGFEPATFGFEGSCSGLTVSARPIANRYLGFSACLPGDSASLRNQKHSFAHSSDFDSAKRAKASPENTPGVCGLSCCLELSVSGASRKSCRCWSKVVRQKMPTPSAVCNLNLLMLVSGKVLMNACFLIDNV